MGRKKLPKVDPSKVKLMAEGVHFNKMKINTKIVDLSKPKGPPPPQARLISNEGYTIVKNKKNSKSMKRAFIKVGEQNRTYVFADKEFTLKDVVSINVSSSGTHRLNTKDGKKHIVSPGWIHIIFDAEQWIF